MNPESPEDNSQFSNIYQGHQTSYEAKNLTPFRTYFFRVQASNSAGENNKSQWIHVTKETFPIVGAGPYSPVAATVTPAAPPSSVAILRSEATPTTIALWWSEPSSNGAEITSYNIDLGDRVIETEEPVTDYRIEGLQPEVQYKVSK